MATLLANADSLDNIMARVRRIKLQIAETAHSTLSLQKHASEGGALTQADQAKMVQYRARLEELQKELQNLLGDQTHQ